MAKFYKAYHAGHRKITCPYCGGRGRFSPYCDPDTLQPIDPAIYGVCDRQNVCEAAQEHFGQDGKMHYGFYPPISGMTVADLCNDPRRSIHTTPPPPPPPKDPFYLDAKLVQQTQRRQHRSQNKLFAYLSGIFGAERVNAAFDRYKVGISDKAFGHSLGAPDYVIWWLIDSAGRVCDGHQMYYHANGKRDRGAKENPNHNEHGAQIIGNTWTAAQLKAAGRITPEEQTRITRPYFGGHLIGTAPEDAPVYVFESEKTALISSLFFPDAVCVGGYGGGALNADKLKECAGRDVYYFADNDKAGFEKWTKHTAEFALWKKWYGIKSFNLYDWIEDDTPEGYDLLDLITDRMQGRTPTPTQRPPETGGADPEDTAPEKSQKQTPTPSPAVHQHEQPPRSERMEDETPAAATIPPDNGDDNFPFYPLDIDPPF